MTSHTELDPLVETKNKTLEPVNEPSTKKRVYALVGLVLLFAVFMFAGAQSTANNRLYLKAASSLTESETTGSRCVSIDGKLTYDSQGRYCESGDTFNGKAMWDRTDGQRFAFLNPDQSWHITGSQWRKGFVSEGKGWKGSFTHGETKYLPSPEFARFPGQKNCVSIDGKLTYDSQGRYCESGDTFNGVAMWDRTDGQRFAFLNPDQSWHITGSQWRKGFVSEGKGWKGSFTHGNKKNQPTPDLARYPGQTICVDIEGKLTYDSQGRYCESGDTFNGVAMWDRTDGQRFAFLNPDQSWHITGSQWREGFVSEAKGNKGSFTHGNNKNQPTPYTAGFPGQ